MKDLINRKRTLQMLNGIEPAFVDKTYVKSFVDEVIKIIKKIPAETEGDIIDLIDKRKAIELVRGMKVKGGEGILLKGIIICGLDRL